MEIQKESEKIFNKKRYSAQSNFFEDIFQDLQLALNDNEDIIGVMKAIMDIGQADGNTQAIEDEFRKKMILQQITKYDERQLRMAISLWHDHHAKFRKEFSQQKAFARSLKKLNRETVIRSELNLIGGPSIDDVDLRKMGEYRALNSKNIEMYRALKENRVCEQDILGFLNQDDMLSHGIKNCEDDDEKRQREEVESIYKFMSEDFQSELRKYCKNENFQSEDIELENGEEDDDQEFEEFDYFPNSEYVVANTQNDVLNLAEKQLINQPNQLSKDQIEQFQEFNKQKFVTKEIKAKLQQKKHKHLLKMFDELDNLDYLLKNSDNNIKQFSTSREDYILKLRLLYHEKLVSLKNAKDMFNTQLNRMQRSHVTQLKNMESFALSAANEIFKQKTHKVMEMFSSEATKLTKKYQKQKELVHFYEKKLRQMAEQIELMEKNSLYQNHFILQFMRRGEELKVQKGKAQKEIENLISEKYMHFECKAYLESPFSFYSIGLRLQATERYRIMKSAVFKMSQIEIKNLQKKVEALENENLSMIKLIEAYQFNEDQAKQKFDKMKEELQQEKDVLIEQFKDMENNFKKKLSQNEKEIEKQLHENDKFKSFTTFELEMLHSIILKAQEIQKDQKEELDHLWQVIDEPKLSGLYLRKCAELLSTKKEINLDKEKRAIIKELCALFKEGKITPMNQLTKKPSVTNVKNLNMINSNSGGRSSPIPFNVTQQDPTPKRLITKIHANTQQDLGVNLNEEHLYESYHQLKPKLNQVENSLITNHHLPTAYSKNNSINEIHLSTRQNSQSIDQKSHFVSFVNKNQIKNQKSKMLRTSLEWNLSSNENSNTAKKILNQTLYPINKQSINFEKLNKIHHLQIMDHSPRIFQQPILTNRPSLQDIQEFGTGLFKIQNSVRSTSRANLKPFLEDKIMINSQRQSNIRLAANQLNHRRNFTQTRLPHSFQLPSTNQSPHYSHQMTNTQLNATANDHNDENKTIFGDKNLPQFVNQRHEKKINLLQKLNTLEQEDPIVKHHLLRLALPGERIKRNFKNGQMSNALHQNGIKKQDLSGNKFERNRKFQLESAMMFDNSQLMIQDESEDAQQNLTFNQ